MELIHRFERESTDRTAFSLHDCRARAAELENGALTFCFPDGIFCAEYGSDWPNTGPASVTFTLLPDRDVCFFVFEKRNGLLVREDVPAERLVEKINAGEWELEFLCRYDGYEEILYRCELWQETRLRPRETQLFIGTKETIFRWNPPAAETDGGPDRPV